MNRTTHLPVLDQLVVRNYPLYPGNDGHGLRLDFTQGITVLAGINGIGKTTLLNLLLRMLLGPMDPKKAERDLGRVSKRTLWLPAKHDYFQLRVPDKLGATATASLRFRLGTRTIFVTRYLHDMGLKSVTVNRVKKTFENEAAFISQLAKWAGAGSAYDFHILVRYLQFFAEDRLPILWSSSTQFEFFKMLFFNEELQTTLNTTYAEIQSVDTNYRNRKNQLTLRENALPEPPETEGVTIGTLRRMVSEAEKTFQQADKEFEASMSAYNTLRQLVFDADEALSRAEASLTDVEARFVSADAHFIAHTLPTLDDKLRFLMQGLGAGQGCFVCGTRRKNQITDIGKELRLGKCFVCHSTLPDDQRDLTTITSAEVRALEAELEQAHVEVEKARIRRDDLEGTIADQGVKMRLASSRRREALQQYEDLQRTLPDDSPAIGDERTWIEKERAALNVLITERDHLVEVYREAVTRSKVVMVSLVDSLRRNFTRYAEAFLREEVAVDISRQASFKPATGAKQVNIPTFTVKMTSSTFKQPAARLRSDSVSESQKEFLDLAFRMALLDMVTPDADMTMVVETPEASLDSYFMRRAADLMRRFTQQEGGHARHMIATSNLNGTTMIPALLGILGNDGKVLSKAKRPAVTGYLVDLVAETARATVLGQEDAAAIFRSELAELAL